MPLDLFALTGAFLQPKEITSMKTTNNKTQISNEETSDYLRPAGAMKYARISRRTLSDWQARRIVPFLKVSRKCVLFRKSDIDKALSRFEVQAVQ